MSAFVTEKIGDDIKTKSVEVADDLPPEGTKWYEQMVQVSELMLNKVIFIKFDTTEEANDFIVALRNNFRLQRRGRSFLAERKRAVDDSGKVTVRVRRVK